ncbi:flagellar basal body-associated FliL family protein [Candidatus Villigracilis saccharophilus]|uniref:flagellar basal body-associated FliL family protein n=1 Tax=Candidatus Villigracilis saccharophilus TaxID=3140684 RepID=UPI0031357448|nr:flagellar basal body-associated FliL family protein [Anaerolineales bacterium]
MLDKILKILNVITQVILLLTAFLSIFMAYIIFAPDELPKPFRLQYQYDTAFTTPEPHVSEAAASEETTTTETGTHDFIPGEGIMVPMSTKIINLVDPGGRRYIRVTVVVEVAPDNPEYELLPEEEKIAYETAFEEKLNSRLPIMDDTVITLLSTKTYEDLYTADGKEKLRTEILETLSEKLVDLHILSIYFTEFVVQ